MLVEVWRLELLADPPRAEDQAAVGQAAEFLGVGRDEENAAARSARLSIQRWMASRVFTSMPRVGSFRMKSSGSRGPPREEDLLLISPREVVTPWERCWAERTRTDGTRSRQVAAAPPG